MLRRQRKHQHKFSTFVDASNARFIDHGGDCTNVLLRCSCGELDHKILRGHFDINKIREAYENDVELDEIVEAANKTKTWLKDKK